MDIIPVNNHLLIQPLKHESLLPTEKGTYEEVGIILDLSKELKAYKKPVFSGSGIGAMSCIMEIEGKAEIGDKVFFDSWLANKFPTDKNDEFFWLVKWDDVRAVQKNGKNPISE